VNPGLVVKLRPAGPWRIGPNSGARDRVDGIYHSDALFSAVTGAMRSLGVMDEWLAATASNENAPVAVFSSCYPFVEEVGLVVPPRHVWPPPASPKIHFKGARFVPLGIVNSLLTGQSLDEDKWSVDGPSECLLPPGRVGPFRATVRSSAAVDRLSGNVHPHSAACVEFSPGAGLWAAISFADDESYARWSEPVRGALRWLADSGFGGERSQGWGRSAAPEFIEGSLPNMILPETPVPVPAEGEEPRAPEMLHWLLSLFTPGPDDAVDWKRGNYAVMARAGRIESPAASGAPKKLVNMIQEGSVIAATGPIRGSATNVAPEGFAHPVYRAGFALAIPVPARRDT
jgi:CRISPR type III-A-associated RAMP protein Csm4